MKREEAIMQVRLLRDMADTMNDNRMVEAIDMAIKALQPEQKEITMEDVKAYCESRNLVVLTKELFAKMNNTADEIYLYLKDRERR